MLEGGIVTKEISLTQGKITLVDDEDFEYLNQFKWCAKEVDKHYYVYRKRKTKTVAMHRVLTNPPPYMKIDHINGDTLDNRKKNLRIVTDRENLQNRHSPRKTSKYPGTYFEKSRKLWHSRIYFNKKDHSLGRYKSELEAATVYQVACAVLINPVTIQVQP
jgi:hypothetical protein